MAKAKQCDRCKKFYTSNKLIKTNGRIHGAYVGGMATTNSDHECDSWYDLCDSCVTDLSIFLHDYKPEQEKKND